MPIIRIETEDGVKYLAPSEAQTALVLGLLSFVAPIIFGPIAVYKAWRALDIIKSHPGMPGSGRAWVGIWLSVFALFLWLISVGIKAGMM